MLTLLAFAALVASQDTVRWTEPACRRCRIEIEQVVALTSPDLLIDVGPLGLARGRSAWYAVQTFGDSTSVGVFRFTSDGKPAGRVARWGRGPGEVVTPSGLRVDAHDSLHVLDKGQMKRLVFDPSGRFVREHPIPRILSGSYAFTPGGGIVLNGTSWGGMGGRPLFAFDAAGNALGPWPEASYRFRASGFSAAGERWLAGDYANRVWVIHGMDPAGPITETRDARSGAIVALYRREGNWVRPLPPPQRPGAPGPKGAQEPHTFALGAALDNGVLWIAYSTSDRDWRRGFGRVVRDSTGSIAYPEFDGRRVVDLVLDAIDARTGRLLASRRFDLAMNLTPDGLLVRGFDSAESHVEVVYRPRLVR